jgi:DNA gyrase/topoisomerase IV subunit B
MKVKAVSLKTAIHVAMCCEYYADGYHITTLVLSNLYHINPKLFEDRIFILNPPLYIVNYKGYPKPIFVRDKTAMQLFRSKYYASQLKLEYRMAGTLFKVSPKQYHAIHWTLRDIGEQLTKAGVRLHINPALLELLVYGYYDIQQKNYRKLTKRLNIEDCRYDEDTQALYLLLDGFETMVPMQGLVEELTDNLVPLFQQFHLFDIEFLATSLTNNFYSRTSVSIMTILNAYDSYDKAYTMRRMKGIGEMDRKHLIETCLNRETRSCTQISGIGDINRIASLMGVDTLARKDLINDNMGD